MGFRQHPHIPRSVPQTRIQCRIVQVSRVRVGHARPLRPSRTAALGPAITQSHAAPPDGRVGATHASPATTQSHAAPPDGRVGARHASPAITQSHAAPPDGGVGARHASPAITQCPASTGCRAGSGGSIPFRNRIFAVPPSTIHRRVWPSSSATLPCGFTETRTSTTGHFMYSQH